MLRASMTAPGDNPLPVTFEAWAELSAMSDEEERNRALATRAPGSQWSDINEYWSSQLARDILATKMERVRHYAGLLAAAPTRPVTTSSPPPAQEAAAVAMQGDPLDVQSTHRMRKLNISQLVEVPQIQQAAQHQSQQAQAQQQAQHVAKGHTAPNQQAQAQQAVQAQQAQRHAAQAQQAPQGQQAAQQLVQSQPLTQSSFVAAMGGDGLLRKPDPGQQHTMYNRTDASTRSDLRAAEAASHWTVEQYACFAAELQAAGPHADSVFSRYGLNSQETREIVTETWARRLDGDPNMRARFDAVLADQHRLRSRS